MRAGSLINCISDGNLCYFFPYMYIIRVPDFEIEIYSNPHCNFIYSSALSMSSV